MAPHYGLPSRHMTSPLALWTRRGLRIELAAIQIARDTRGLNEWLDFVIIHISTTYLAGPSYTQLFSPTRYAKKVGERAPVGDLRLGMWLDDSLQRNGPWV